MAGDNARATAAKKRKWPAAITAMLLCRTMSDAAKLLRMGVTTLYEWRRDPEFQALLAEAQRDIALNGISSMTINQEQAARTEKRLLKSKNEEIALEALRLQRESAKVAFEALQLHERLKRIEEGQSSPP